GDLFHAVGRWIEHKSTLVGCQPVEQIREVTDAGVEEDNSIGVCHRRPPRDSHYFRRTPADYPDARAKAAISTMMSGRLIPRRRPAARSEGGPRATPRDPVPVPEQPLGALWRPHAPLPGPGSTAGSPTTCASIARSRAEMSVLTVRKSYH